MRARALIKCVRIRRADVLYGALTRPSAEKLNWFKLKDAVFQYGLTDDFEMSDYKLRAICKRTGAMYTMTGMQDDADIEGYRGQPFDEVQVDEAASHDPDRVYRFVKSIVGPRLGERRGCLILGGTPGTRLRGLFYDTTRPGAMRTLPDGSSVPVHRRYTDRDLPEFANWQSWSSHAWKLKDVVDLPNSDKLYPALCANYAESLIEKAESGWSDDHPIWLREWCGIWAADDTTGVFQYKQFDADGAPWNMWDPFPDRQLEGLAMLQAALEALPEEHDDWRFVVIIDTGSAHPCAINIFAFCPNDKTRTIWHVFCFERTGMHQRPIAEMLLGTEFVSRLLADERVDWDDTGGLLGLTGWPTAMELDGDQPHIDELQRVYGLRFTKAIRTPSYKAGAIELVNGDLHDGRIKVLRNSQLEKQLIALQWEEDRWGNVQPSRKQADHSADCLIYGRRLIAHLFDGGIASDGKSASSSGSPTSSVYADPMGLDDGDRQSPAGEYDSLLSSTEYGGL